LIGDAEIVFEERHLGPAPALIARPALGVAPWPAALWFHGFAADRNASKKFVSESSYLRSEDMAERRRRRQ
jgi:hypothetical protein